MGFFDHEHSWLPKTDINTIKGSEGGTAGCLIVEGCHCGAVRTIEVYPGKAPVVRMAAVEAAS